MGNPKWAYSSVECQEHCQKTIGCFYWTYVGRENWCYLKDGSFNWDMVFVKDGTKRENGRRRDMQKVSGPKFCPLCFKREKGISYNIHKKYVETIGECQDECKNQGNCNGFSHKLQSEDCYLRTTDLPGRKVTGRTHKFVSGPETCHPGRKCSVKI